MSGRPDLERYRERQAAPPIARTRRTPAMDHIPPGYTPLRWQRRCELTTRSAQSRWHLQRALEYVWKERLGMATGIALRAEYDRLVAQGKIDPARRYPRLPRSHQRKTTRCLRCGHRWRRKTRHPVECPRCHNPFWNRPRRVRKTVENQDMTR